MMRYAGFLVAVAATVGASHFALAGATTVVLKGMDAAKVLFQQGDYDKAKFAAATVAWEDINQPEALRFIGLCLDKLGDREQAAAFYHLCLRVLEEDPKSKADPRTPSRRATCQKELERLDVAYRIERDDYLKATAGKAFASPEKVSDLWMTQVKVDLHSLHGLYDHKLVGGRKDVKPDWIHNTQGAMHRSGAKLMDDIQGRKGVLFCVPDKKSHRQSRLIWEGPVKGKVLRIGAMAYNFPYLLNVVVGDKQLLSKTIGKDKWADLRIPLGTAPSKDAPLILELVIPEDQRWAEGAFFDYVDFFDD